MAQNNTQQNIAGNKSSQDQLRTYVERIERLEEEKKALGQDIGEVYGEAKGNGYDVKVMRRLISDRRKQPQELQEMESLLDLYKQALGMI
jgi:uncharacterized protein (UPF0335 family)